MSHHVQPDHILIRSRSRRWRHVKTSTVVLIAIALFLTICAWISLVFSPRTVRCGQHRYRSFSIFPWEPHDLHNSSISISSISGRRSIDSIPLVGSSERWPGHGSMNFSQDLKTEHILFGIAGAAQLWPRRKEYVKLWWRPKEMRGFVWLEKFVASEPEDELLLPPVRVSEDISNFSYTNPTGHPAGLRIARIIREAFRLNVPNVRWFVMGDDDTVFAVDNLVRVLKKYDWRELYYIGNPSESHSSNTYFSHGMAFGGGGIAISYPLAHALSAMFDDCLERYPFLFGSDDRLHACISELGVPLTKEPGFHQFDLHGNAFGLLAGHPIAPFISMHHLEEVDPFFPHYNALKGLRHLTKAMKTEPSSFLQRCICYDREKKLTFSVSLGYVVQLYSYVLLPRELERSEITFKAWNQKNGGGEFDFDTRAAIKSVCNKPALFFLDRMYHDESDVVSIYKRDTSSDSKKRWSLCFSYTPNMEYIQVKSKPMNDRWFKVPRRQCCRVKAFLGQNLNISMGSCQPGKMKIY